MMNTYPKVKYLMSDIMASVFVHLIFQYAKHRKSIFLENLISPKKVIVEIRSYI